DIMCYDACLMQMVEVGYEAQGYIDYIVGSEETEPGKGTPYDDVLNALSTKTLAVEDFAKAWTKAYIASYNHGSQGYEACTQSTMKVAAYGDLCDAVNGFAKAAMVGKFQVEFADALSKVQKFAYPENIDLIHFMNLLKT
ncbi:MAG: peptidase C11, partial [Candidatus Riflebacteria bacterium]|nr:peptidase C11 [Candidatus Riflebacteria bacterium]